MSNNDFVLNGLAIAIKRAIVQQAKMQKKVEQEPYIRLFSDAKPSESIHKHELPGLGVASIFAYSRTSSVVDVPVKQYKDYDRSKKARKATELREWMEGERKSGNLVITGFMNTLTQQAAAKFGLDLIEELPSTRVENHHGGYRLYFGEEHIDLAQAVALIYYMLTVSFAVLRTATSIEKEHRRHIIALLDRFPDTERGGFLQGQKAPKTQGMKFVLYIKANAKTFVDIDAENKSSGIAYKPDTLEGWRPNGIGEWKDPKTHPHFVLVDWLVASAIAKHFPEEFLVEYRQSKLGKKRRNAEDALEALVDLYQEFKKHQIFEIANDETLGHIIASDGHREWKVPEEVKEFILNRAEK